MEDLTLNTAVADKKPKKKDEDPLVSNVEIKSTSGTNRVKPKGKKISSYSSFLCTSGTGNCKLKVFDSFGNFLSRVTDDETLEEVIRQTMGGKKVFLVHLLNKKQIERLAKVFDLVYAVRVPIGYGDGFQYHALYRSPKDLGSYDRRLDNEGAEVIGINGKMN